ncbi:RHS repeat domain-containing protein [Bacteroides sp. KG123]|uniref:RHS repeat domain-containing protein n=1 Tax=unclassified Bacteroides TaxID=2646097 RepID=UPI003D7FAAED
MPHKVFGANHPLNEYVYSASGRKLTAIHRSTSEKRTDYVGNLIYENGSLKRILFDGGYIEDGQYHFYFQDHLGNNRVVSRSDGSVVQTVHYYPYGLPFAKGTLRDRQPYKYNGKKLDTERGLNQYDYAARQLDLAAGRFTSIDPLAEKYYDTSPYMYCGNNPVSGIDPDGRDWYRHNDIGSYRWQEGHGGLDGYTRLGASVSIELGKDTYFNAYQKGGILANRVVNAFELIRSSPVLQNRFLGKYSPLSEQSKSELFNALNNLDLNDLGRPVGEALVELSIAQLGGFVLSKALGWGLGRLATEGAAKTSTSFFNGTKYTNKVLDR